MILYLQVIILSLGCIIISVRPWINALVRSDCSDMHVVRVSLGCKLVVALPNRATSTHFRVNLSDNILLLIIFIKHPLYGELVASDGGVVLGFLLAQRRVYHA